MYLWIKKKRTGAEANPTGVGRTKTGMITEEIICLALQQAATEIPAEIKEMKKMILHGEPIKTLQKKVPIISECIL